MWEWQTSATEGEEGRENQTATHNRARVEKRDDEFAARERLNIGQEKTPGNRQKGRRVCQIFRYVDISCLVNE